MPRGERGSAGMAVVEKAGQFPRCRSNSGAATSGTQVAGTWPATHHADASLAKTLDAAECSGARHAPSGGASGRAGVAWVLTNGALQKQGMQ